MPEAPEQTGFGIVRIDLPPALELNSAGKK
jgi:hypothetical protein